MTVQAQILRLMKDLQREYGMAIMFITHDLGVIAADRGRGDRHVPGQDRGRGAGARHLPQPVHPYTRKLMAAVPDIDLLVRGSEHKHLQTIDGFVPEPSACRMSVSSTSGAAMPGMLWRWQPRLVEVTPGHFVRCFKYGDHEREGRE